VIKSDVQKRASELFMNQKVEYKLKQKGQDLAFDIVIAKGSYAPFDGYEFKAYYSKQ